MTSTRTLSQYPAIFYMDMFFRETEFNHKNTISSVSVTRICKDEEEAYIMVMVATSMPGVLIGKGGQYISKLEKYLTEKIKPLYPIKIHITEKNIWYNTMGSDNFDEFEKKCKEY